MAERVGFIVAPYILWDDTPVDYTANQAIAANAASLRDGGALSRAREFLRELLANGPVSAKDAEEAADQWAFQLPWGLFGFPNGHSETAILLDLPVLLDHAGSATLAELGAKCVGIARLLAPIAHVHGQAAAAQIMFGLYKGITASLAQSIDYGMGRASTDIKPGLIDPIAR